MIFYKETSYRQMTGFALLCILLTALLITNDLLLISQPNKTDMQKKIINTAHAPAPIGPYSQAVLAGNILYLSGQVCIDPASGNLKNRDVQEETEQVMQNLKAVLQEAGMSFGNVVKTTIFLTDMNRFAE